MTVEQLFDAERVNKVHELSGNTKTVVLIACWSLVFDVNGNAPSDADVAFFATEELATQALKIFAAKKDDDQDFAIIVNGKRHTDLRTYSVEGYDFDTYYRVDEAWQPAEKIMRSLADLTQLTDSVDDTTSPDGVFFNDN